MELTFTKDGDYGILTITGNIDHLTTNTLKHHLQTVVDHACPYMIVDISNVVKLSVSGLGLIFAGKNRLSEIGAQMAIVGPVREMNKLLEPGSMGKMVPLCPSIERAKIALRKLAFDQRTVLRRKRRQQT